MQSKSRSSAFEALHLSIRHRIPNEVNKLVNSVKDVTNDIADFHYNTEAH